MRSGRSNVSLLVILGLSAGVCVTQVRSHAAQAGPPPTVLSVTPGFGQTAGGTLITVAGANFEAGATSVAVGGSPATSVTVISTSTLTAVTPIGAVGSANVVVTTASGTATLTGGFTYGTAIPAFTDEPLQPGLTSVKAAHITELRDQIDQLRLQAGVGAFGWTDHPLVAGVSTVKAAHLAELRQAVASLYSLAGKPQPIWREPVILSGATPIAAPHIEELRAAVVGVPASATPTRVIALSGNLAFGNVTVGTTATSQMMITNSGNSTLTVTGMTGPSWLSASWLSGTVAPGSSQSVTVGFTPTTAGNHSGTITVLANHTSGTNTIGVSGTGTVVPPSTRVIALSGSLAFGTVPVGTAWTLPLTISNSGNSALTVSSISYPTGFSGAWSGTVPAGGSQNVTVTFAPTAVQSYGGTVTVNANQTSGTNTIWASGTATGSTASAYHVWGGPNYTIYLGYFVCTFCTDYGADSINNQYGSYGSQYSSTSIRNQYSQYGSPYASYSACNPYTSTPPRVYNASGTVYYGELTLNSYRPAAIASLLNWLTYDVCAH